MALSATHCRILYQSFREAVKGSLTAKVGAYRSTGLVDRKKMTIVRMSDNSNYQNDDGDRDAMRIANATMTMQEK